MMMNNDESVSIATRSVGVCVFVTDKFNTKKIYKYQ